MFVYSDAVKKTVKEIMHSDARRQARMLIAEYNREHPEDFLFIRPVDRVRGRVWSKQAERVDSSADTL